MASPYKKILMIGAGGGREHALAWKLKISPRVGEIFFARGNAGTAGIGKNLDIRETNMEKLYESATKNKIDLVLVVSDDPLAVGIADEFRGRGFRTWGPSRAAAKLEWSKAYAKEFMRTHNIPTARFEIFDDMGSALSYIKREKFPLAIKASGLALGKGVTIVQNEREGEDTLRRIFVDRVFGEAGNEVVIEEYLYGTEISIHAISDGKNFKMFPASQDHKRIFDGNQGPNTGGMGTIAPLPIVTPEIMGRIEKEIVRPTIEGMAKAGTPFVGILYPGLMLTPEGPKVFEFNVRFGDPETQSYMRLLESDLLELIDASIDGKVGDLEMRWRNIFACNIAIASAGYPGNYEKGKEIHGIDEVDSGIVIFHGGTKSEGDKILTDGGRVLGVSATGDTMDEALAKAYKAIEGIFFEGMQYRNDIGKNAFGHRMSK